MVTAIKFPESRTYNRRECITFRKTAERFGGLSNMAGGYLLEVNNIKILTSEALYQACRFPHLPEVQRLIIAERSPMTAKMKSKPYRDNSRPDWDAVRTKVMRWCLQVKLVQNWTKFSQLLLETEDLPIVEDSRKDDFWGAKPKDEQTLIGANVLGRLLMQLREQVKSGEITAETIVNPLVIPDFWLYGTEIKAISAKGEFNLFCDNNLPNSHQLTSPPPLEGMEPELKNYDAFQIILPYIESALKTECTNKELAAKFDIPQTLMRNWLDRAVKLGKVKKLSKPVRFITESQLLLFD